MTFSLVHRPHGDCWLHSDGRKFICFYEGVEGVRPAYFQAYMSKAQPPKGRDPWTVDNRRIGTDRGFPTFDEAAQAAEAVAA